jgi:hypothetical protein
MLYYREIARPVSGFLNSWTGILEYDSSDQSFISLVRFLNSATEEWRLLNSWTIGARSRGSECSAPSCAIPIVASRRLAIECGESTSG